MSDSESSALARAKKNWEEHTGLWLLGLLLAAFSAGVGFRELDWFKRSTDQLPAPVSATPLASVPRVGSIGISLVYPDPALLGKAGHEDGFVQAQGFARALEENPFDEKRIPYEFGADHAEIMERMKSQYAVDGSRVFIVTMSKTVSKLKSDFAAWRSSIETEKPILIATVASAPDLADAANGIYRYYVRSEEESRLLAQYGVWQLGLREVGLFAVSSETDKVTNPYGVGALKTFKHEFEDDLGGTIQVFPILDDGRNAEDAVKRFMAPSDLQRGAFIVGYDQMLQATLRELARQRYAGHALCTSTLTEPRWQPGDRSLDERLVTVTPHRHVPTGVAEGSVVTYFAYRTLVRAIRCANKSDGVEAFELCWQTSEDNDDGLSVAHLANGDAIVPLEVLTSWRQ